MHFLHFKNPFSHSLAFFSHIPFQSPPSGRRLNYNINSQPHTATWRGLSEKQLTGDFKINQRPSLKQKKLPSAVDIALFSIIFTLHVSKLNKLTYFVFKSFLTSISCAEIM